MEYVEINDKILALCSWHHGYKRRCGALNQARGKVWHLVERPILDLISLQYYWSIKENAA